MADNRKFVQAQRFTLAGSGCSTTATSINISSFKHLQAAGNTDITMSDFGTLGFGTLEPGTGREELISFTGVTQNIDGTATLTGVTRNLKPYSPYNQYSGTGFAHSGGASFVLSNNPGLYDSFANKENDETISGVWTFDADNPPRTDAATAPVDDEELTNKKYVDDQNDLDVHLTGNQTIAGNKTFTGDTVFNEIASYDAHPTFVNDTDIIDKKYADDLAFAGAPDASTTVKGIVEEATAAETIAGTTTGGTGARLFVNPSSLLDAAVSKTSSAGAGDSGKFIRADATGKVDPSFLYEGGFGDGSDGDVTISTPTTLSRDMYYNNLVLNSTLHTGQYRVYVRGTISGSGTISAAGGNGSNGGTGAGSSGTNTGGAAGTNAAGYFPECNGTQGGAGASSSSAPNAEDASSTAAKTAALGNAGGNGGNGGAISGGTAGTAGTCTDPVNNQYLRYAWQLFSAIILDNSLAVQRLKGATGGGGGGGGNGSGTGVGGGGGGGGAGGGILFLSAYDWAGTFTITVAGGNGGNGNNASGGTNGNPSGGGGGGGGGGGAAIVIYGVKSWTGSYVNSGGTGGTAGTGLGTGGTGLAGSNGSTGNALIEIPISQLIR